MVTERQPSIVYFDGSCPLCRAEIGMYSRHDSDGALCFVDISARSASVPECRKPFWRGLIDFWCKRRRVRRSR